MTFALAIVILVVIVGVVAGLTYFPGSPGFPYISPTYQAQRANFDYMAPSGLAVIYQVWYVPSSSTLILILAATHSHTVFYGFWAHAGRLPTGNFSTKLTINIQRTYLVIPANSCPNTNRVPPGGEDAYVSLLGSSPVGMLFFKYTCVGSPFPTTITLGNPHILVGNTVQPTGQSTEDLNLTSYQLNSSTNVSMTIDSTGNSASTITGYNVSDTNGDRYSRTSLSQTINSTTSSSFSLPIGASCTSCSLSGSDFRYTAAYTYSIVLTTSRGNWFMFIISF